MQTYHVRLESIVSKSYRCTRAANSLDIDAKKKSIHELKITADITSPFNLGIIVGASGSGKTTLAKQIFGPECFKSYLDESKPIIEQFPKEYDYDKCAKLLSGVGLTSVPCWIRPVYTLSNGQKARAEAALAMAIAQDTVIIDEWTSVVDRTVAKVMSHCVAKHVRRENAKIILLSCHYDVLEWLDPDWIIDCNEQKFINRRLLSTEERRRKEQLYFTIRQIDQRSWSYFSRYHYLSDSPARGKVIIFGMFHGEQQIAFLAYTNYVPRKPGTKMIMHSNRLVIHPDFAGFGMGIKFVNECSKIVKNLNYRVMAKFSSIPMYKHRIRDNKWRFIKSETKISNRKPTKMGNIDTGFRLNVRTFSFEFIG